MSKEIDLLRAKVFIKEGEGMVWEIHTMPNADLFTLEGSPEDQLWLHDAFNKTCLGLAQAIGRLKWERVIEKQSKENA